MDSHLVALWKHLHLEKFNVIVNNRHYPIQVKQRVTSSWYIFIVSNAIKKKNTRTHNLHECPQPASICHVQPFYLRHFSEVLKVLPLSIFHAVELGLTGQPRTYHQRKVTTISRHAKLLLDLTKCVKSPTTAACLMLVLWLVYLHPKADVPLAEIRPY